MSGFRLRIRGRAPGSQNKVADALSQRDASLAPSFRLFLPCSFFFLFQAGWMKKAGRKKENTGDESRRAIFARGTYQSLADNQAQMYTMPRRM